MGLAIGIGIGTDHTGETGDDEASSIFGLTAVTPQTVGDSGDIVEFIGQGFEATAVAKINSQALTSPSNLNATAITGGVPASGLLDGLNGISVTNLSGPTTVSLANALMRFCALSVSPVSAKKTVATAITITGVGFTTNPDGSLHGYVLSTVKVGGVNATSAVIVNDTTITCTTPTTAADGDAAIAITFTNAMTASRTGIFTIFAAPTVASLSVSSGEDWTTTATVLTGTNYHTGSTVTCNGVACTGVTVVNSTTINCTIPATTRGAGVSGAKNIVVTDTFAQTGTLAGGFTYNKTPWAVTSANMVGWWRADQGVTQSSGVTGWADLSGNALNLASSGAGKPVFTASDASFNNKPSISFSTDTGRYLETAGAPTASISSAIFMAASVGDTTANRFFCFIQGPTKYFYRNTSSKLIYSSTGTLTSSTNLTTASVIGYATTGHLGTDAAMYINSATANASGATVDQTFVTSLFTLGNYAAHAGSCMGAIPECVFFDAPLSAGDTSDVINYLGTRYAITIT